jgi:hypothetical protein
MQRYKKKLLITNKWRRFFCFGRHWYGMELVSAIMANSHYAIAKVQKVLDLQAEREKSLDWGKKNALIHYCIRAGWGLLFIYFSSSFNTLNVSSDIFSNR